MMVDRHIVIQTILHSNLASDRYHLTRQATVWCGGILTHFTLHLCFYTFHLGTLHLNKVYWSILCFCSQEAATMSVKYPLLHQVQRQTVLLCKGQ